MDPADPRRPIPRDRALHRLHRLTLASATISVVATGAFATIAAASDSGSHTTTVGPARTSAATPDPTAVPFPADDDTTGNAPVPLLRPSTGRRHATTGGSS